MSLALSDPIQKFFRIPLVIFSIHAVLIGSTLVIGNQLWINYQDRRQIQILLDQNQALASSNATLSVQKDYFQSSLYAEKAAKEAQLKNKGEVVVDTSGLDGNKIENTNDYVPEQPVRSDSNPEKWLEFLWGGDSQTNQ